MKAGKRREPARRRAPRAGRVPEIRSGTPSAVPDILKLVGIEKGEITAEREVVLELGRTYHLLIRFITEILERVGVTPQQYAILEVLARRSSGLGQDELRSIMVCSRPNLSGLVDRMVRSGFIASRAAPQDRRRRILTVTARGEALLDRARPLYRDALHRLFTPVTPSVRGMLIELIREVRKPLEESPEAR